MDNLDLRWSPPIALAWLAGVGAIALAAAGLLASDAPGMLIATIGALILAVTAINVAVRRPRIAVTADPKLAIRGLRGTAAYGPADITRARVHVMNRLGRKTALLEIDVRDADGRDRLIMFGRWSVGTHPQGVLDAMRRVGLVP